MRNYSDELVGLYSTKAVDEVETNYIAVPSITFQVTEDCQLRCAYCYQTNKTHSTMSLETAKKFIDLLIANDDNTKQYIDTEKCTGVILDFIGGEPLLQPKLIDDIITYFRTQTILHNHPWQYNWRISISSNGVAYFNPEVQELIKKYKDHLSLSITLDGNKELHDACRKFPNGEGSYDKAIAAIRHYKEYWHGFMGSKVTFSPMNIKYAGSAIINLIEEGYTEIHANCVFEKGWEYSDATIFYNEMKKIADYILDNNLEYKVNVSLFVENFFRPLNRDNTQNWCWGAGTPILTDQGYKPIEELKIGDKVYTADGTVHPIINTMSHFADNCIQIHNSGTFDLICTDNHQIYAMPFDYIGNQHKKHWKPYGKYTFSELKDSKDLVELFRLPTGLIDIDEELAYLIGRYVGDGWDTNENSRHHICCAFNETEELKQHFINAGISFTINKNKTVDQFIITQDLKNNNLHNILQTCGHLATGKRFPPDFIKWNKKSQKALLKGYLDADGYHNNNNNYNKINTVSYYLAEDVMLLLRTLGYTPTCCVNKRSGKSIILNREVNIHDRYEICFYDDPKRTRYVKEQDSKLWTSHLTIKPAEPQMVYNITVDTNHSYIAGGIVSSNCGGNGRMLSLGPDGRIYPCLRYAPSSLGDVKPVIAGDVDNGIMTTQEWRDAINELKSVNRINQSTEECIECPIAMGCAYCQAYNYQDSGNFHHRATYICPMHKARALANSYYWNKFYIKNLSCGRFKNYLPDEEALRIIDKEELQMLKDLENTPISE